MMIEQASAELLEPLAQALGIVLPETKSLWLEHARTEGVPLIAGWDLRGRSGERCVKLYLNASDASRLVRTRLCRALAHGVTSDGEPPAVIGMNMRGDGVVETKLYVQSADAMGLALRVGAAAQALARAVREEGADAGGVLSFDAANDGLRPRAFFVALREPGRGTWRCIRSLPGYDACTMESLLPFAPAPPRSVGISLANDAWTLYFKPENSSRAPEALEPAATFCFGEVEVGVFVEPTAHAKRAFRRTERHAVSVRVRHGTPPAAAVELLIDWFTVRLRAAESDGSSIAARVTDPPFPWRIVGASDAADTRERS
jgi:hypothetical protein